jgi:hypothetical protein
MKYKISWGGGWKTVSGKVVGFCGYRRSTSGGSFYLIDHVPTGGSLWSVTTWQRAEIYVKALEHFHLNYHEREAVKHHEEVGCRIARMVLAIDDGRFIGVGYRRCSQ